MVGGNRGTGNRSEGGQMPSILEQVGSLLLEAGEAHHRVYRIVQGADDDWASRYACWLIEFSELPACWAPGQFPAN
jgi:hypothetical protein